MVNSEVKICICYSSHLGSCTNVLTEQFLQGHVSLRHLLNEETLFISLQRYAIKEVNDRALRFVNLMGFANARILAFLTKNTNLGIRSITFYIIFKNITCLNRGVEMIKKKFNLMKIDIPILIKLMAPAVFQIELLPSERFL